MKHEFPQALVYPGPDGTAPVCCPACHWDAHGTLQVVDRYQTDFPPVPWRDMRQIRDDDDEAPSIAACPDCGADLDPDTVSPRSPGIDRYRAHADVVRRADTWLTQNMATLGETPVDEVAAALQVPRRTLQREMARAGVTIRRLLWARRMDQAAKSLAEQPGQTIAAAAAAVGYRQPAQFARAFRRRHGVAPADYRTRHLVAPS